MTRSGSDRYARKNLFVIRDIKKEKKWGEPRIYWCSDGVGYTPELEDAGRWTIEAARIMVNQEPDRLVMINWGVELDNLG